MIDTYCKGNPRGAKCVEVGGILCPVNVSQFFCNIEETKKADNTTKKRGFGLYNCQAF